MCLVSREAPVTVTISRGQVMFTIVQMPCGQWPGKG